MAIFSQGKLVENSLKSFKDSSDYGKACNGHIWIVPCVVSDSSGVFPVNSFKLHVFIFFSTCAPKSSKLTGLNIYLGFFLL